MPLSILLTAPWDTKASDVPRRLDIPKVRPHRFSWKRAGSMGIPKNPWAVVTPPQTDNDDGGSSEDAEVITVSTDESLFLRLHGVLAREANYDELAEWVTGDDYAGMLDVIREMAKQHPETMWFVKAWAIEASALD